MSLLLENFCLNIFYDNVLLHFGSEWVKIHNVKKKKISFIHNSNKTQWDEDDLLDMRTYWRKRLIYAYLY